MTRLLLASSVLTLALGGGSAFAQGTPYPAPPPPQQYGGGYGGYGGGYDEGAPQGQRPAARMADRLLEDTAELRDRIAREIPMGPQRDAALQSVRHLERQAQRFEQSVDNLGADSEPARAEFGRLAQAYGRAANDIETLRNFPGVYYEFAHIQRMMDRMAPMFGGYQQYGYRYESPGNGYRMSGPGLNFGIGGLNFHIGRD